MTTYRKTAIFAGLLFILATATSLTSFMGIIDPILTRPDYLAGVAAQPNLVVTGVLFELVNNFAVAAIGIVLYPVLRRYSVALALAYIAARLSEALVITLGDLSLLTLVSLARASLASGADLASYQITADMLKSVVDWVFLLGPGVLLAINVVILNVILYRTRLVPAFLSLWGLAGAALLFVGDILGMYGIGDVVLFAAPFALQEMVFALWLIVKGFTPRAVQALPSV